MNISEALAKLSIVFFVISLALPVTCCSFGGQDVYGYLALLMGWIGMTSIDGLPWIANILILISWITFHVKKDYRLSLVLAGISSLLALYGVFIHKYDDPLLVGVYFWLLSIVLALVGFIVATVLSRKRV